MQQLIQSHFLMALGYALINSLWQFAILWLTYLFVQAAIKLSAHQKYSTGVVLQFAGFGWFLFSFFSEYLASTHAINDGLIVPESLASVTDTSFSGNSIFLRLIEQSIQLLPFISIIYIFILLLLSLKWLQAYRHTVLLRTKGLQKAEVKIRLFAQKLSRQLGIKRTVTIFLSEVVKTPLTIGFFKPIILIPIASVNHLSTEQMEAVILHELAHIKRFDYLFNLFLALVEVTLFFNPFMHLIARYVKKERENCCDDWVLQYEYNAASYAHALFTIASFQASSPSLALAAAGDQNILLNRIKRMIEKKEKSLFQYRYQTLALFVGCIILSSLTLFSGFEQSNKADIVTSYPGTGPGVNKIVSEKSVLFLPPKLHAQPDTQKKREQLFAYRSVTPPSTHRLPALQSPPPPREINSSFFGPPSPSFAQEPVADELNTNNAQQEDAASAYETARNAIALPVEDMKTAEMELKKLAANLANEKAKFLQQQGNNAEMKSSADQLFSKLQMQIARGFLSDAAQKRLNENQNAVLLFSNKTQKAAAQIQQSLKGANDQLLQLQKEKFNVEMPDFEYSFPQGSVNLNFSDDTNEKPARADGNNNAAKGRQRFRAMVSDGNDAEWSDDGDLPTPPAPSVKPTTVILKSHLRIIKI